MQLALPFVLHTFSVVRSDWLEVGNNNTGEILLREKLTCRDLKPHRLVAATAFKNRVFLMAIAASGTQWRKSKGTLKQIQSSFELV